MKLSELFQREKLFISAALGLILILSYAGGMKGIKVEEPFPAGFHSPTRAEVIGAIQSGKIPPLVAGLLNLLFVVFVTLLIAGIALNISGWLKRSWQIFPRGPSPEAAWGIWPVVKIAVYFMFIFFLFQIMENNILSLFGIEKVEHYSVLLVVNTLIQDGLIIALVFAFLRKAGCSSADLRLKFRDWYRRLRQAVRGYIFFFPFLIILIWISFVVTQNLGFEFKPHPLVEPLLEKGGPVLLVGLFCIGVFLASLVEEIFFRGFVYPAVKKGTSVLGAILISAALFSTLHLSWGGWLPIFGLGVLLAYSYEKTGSLLLPIFIHAIHNSLFLSYTVLLFRISRAV